MLETSSPFLFRGESDPLWSASEKCPAPPLHMLLHRFPLSLDTEGSVHDPVSRFGTSAAHATEWAG
eukprot:14699586-Alexandrium_andersonii.AAC.1